MELVKDLLDPFYLKLQRTKENIKLDLEIRNLVKKKDKLVLKKGINFLIQKKKQKLSTKIYYLKKKQKKFKE